MHDARLVRGLEPLGNLPADVERVANRESAVPQARGERLSRNEFHDKEPLAVVLLEPEQRRNPRVIERREHAGLALEASHSLRVSRETSCGSNLRATSRPSDLSRAR